MSEKSERCYRSINMKMESLEGHESRVSGENGKGHLCIPQVASGGLVSELKSGLIEEKKRLFHVTISIIYEAKIPDFQPTRPPITVDRK
jgi:hypothetical protein